MKKKKDNGACCVEGCTWRDNQINSKRYGIYLTDGNYYCPDHGYEVDKKLSTGIGEKGFIISESVLEMEKMGE